MWRLYYFCSRIEVVKRSERRDLRFFTKDKMFIDDDVIIFIGVS